ncbi:HIT family protein [Deinococcus yavapaiensis]|uniref:Diadenosine tetraphosphate (Ap4A) HIT family hydrolase n=1 Tax=Deinococcus yavapaiensis KR-236 TaxID=694435 RepID=A0A318S673_9DEIO|nr:hypothetical protein [Deinococcus yavapaiensis]PYE49979.1 diadenosine tetraphosphate (Ap4A) HIT family hydrolase [Deinococcus yavapaiensis KR-236]
MTTWHDFVSRGIPGRLEAARAGLNPTVIARMPSGFAVLGDSQFLPGYALLLADPLAPSLEDLDELGQTTFLRDMARLGRAIRAVTGCARVNYGIYGNTDPYLQAHVWARYDWEDAERRATPAWFYPPEVRFAPDALFDSARHADLLLQLRATLNEENGRSGR